MNDSKIVLTALLLLLLPIGAIAQQGLKSGSVAGGGSSIVSPVSGAVATGLDFNAMRGTQLLELLRRQQQNQIEELILERGAYGHGLAEAYGNLGNLNFENGAYSEAADAYRQAWHLSRIETGLYSAAQIPYLNRLTEALAEAGHWNEVQQLHQLGFQIASRIYSPEDREYLGAAEYYADWQWRSISEQLAYSDFVDVFAAAQQLSAFYSEVIDKLEHSSSPSSAGLFRLLVGKTRTDLSIAKALMNSRIAGSVFGPGSYITETRCFSDSGTDVESVRRCRKIRLASFDIEQGTMTSANFALGRYLKQLDGSLERLDRLKKAGRNLSNEDKQRIQESILEIQGQVDSLFRPARRGPAAG